MTTCTFCDSSEKLSAILPVCPDCIRTHYGKALPLIKKVHAALKKTYYMPETPPQEGVSCRFCINRCKISEGESGYCGARKNVQGRIVSKSGSGNRAYVECYYDLLPTNCVSMPFCGEKFTKGKKNLAVFYGACTYNCLSCQNWHYRTLKDSMSVDDLVSRVDEDTVCICFFGGDPTPQISHPLEVARRVETRICWETNGAFSRPLARKVGKSAFASGGTIKFDLKAYSEKINYALCGSSNKNTLANFKYIYETFPRKEPPILVASTLLIPGYIDVEEVSWIAAFIGSIDPDIPYCLLAFHPHFKMQDLSRTSRDHAHACLEAAQAHVTNVDIGNIWLLE